MTWASHPWPRALVELTKANREAWDPPWSWFRARTQLHSPISSNFPCPAEPGSTGRGPAKEVESFGGGTRGELGARRRQQTARLREAGLLSQRAELRDRLAELCLKGTHSILPQSQPQREEAAPTAPRILREVTTCFSDMSVAVNRGLRGPPWRGEGWSVLGRGSRFPAPLQAREPSQRGSGKPKVTRAVLPPREGM